MAAAIFAAAVASHAIQAQDAVVPSGRLVFRASSLEFQPDGIFLAHTVLEGIGDVRATGTWKAQQGTIELSGYKLLAGAELLKAASIPFDGCPVAGQYRFERRGNQLRLSVIGDACVPRNMFLDKTRWAPPGEPNLAPPRTLTRSMFDRSVRLPSLEDGSGSWPSFRGPHASGIADGHQVPERWNIQTGENILWRTSIPGLAHSSPIVWNHRLFVTSAVSSRGKATVTATTSSHSQSRSHIVASSSSLDGRHGLPKERHCCDCLTARAKAACTTTSILLKDDLTSNRVRPRPGLPNGVSLRIRHSEREPPDGRLASALAGRWPPT